MNSLSFTEKLDAIGMLIGESKVKAKSKVYVDIESTLAEALVTIHQHRDRMRLLTILLTWIEVHGWCIIQEKFKKILQEIPEAELKDSYAALVGAFATSRKMKSWDHLFDYAPDLGASILEISQPSAIALRGREEWALRVNFNLATGSLETNKKWVMSRSQLAKTLAQYKNRLIIGPNWRADVYTAVGLGATRAADVQKLIPISKEPANRIIRDLKDAGFVKVFNDSMFS